MPSTHDPYRIPGTKPKRNPWLVYIPILVVLAAVAFAVGFLARNPHFFGWLGAQLEQPKAPQEAAAPPVPTPAPVNPQDPTTYLDLVKYDPATLPPDQARIASALIKKAMVLDRVPPDEVAALQVLDKEVFAPLRAAKNETELAAVRSAAQKLGEACQKTRDFYAQVQESVRSDLQVAGLDENLAGAVAAKFVERSQSKTAARTAAATEVSQNTVVMVDFLAQNSAKWSRQGDKLAFSSRSTKEQFDRLAEEHRAAIDRLNAAIRASQGQS
jgi:hypothetical protein